MGQVLVMSDGKCKSNVVSHSIVMDATVEQKWRLREDNFNDGHKQFLA